MREKERQVMEDKQLVDRQDIRKNLKDAIVFIGTCSDMCPTFERVRRTYEKNVKHLEKDPNTGLVTKQFAVKAFSRPAAGQPPPLPSDVRPPKVLVQTLDYLIKYVVPQLPTSHSFLWDRTRSIRQDFTYQNYTGDEAIHCHELIARIHILCLHVMAGSDQDYSAQQEMEQLRKTLQSLSEFYNDNRKRGLQTSPREPEMRAYQLICHLRDPELEYQVQRLPKSIFDDCHVQETLKLRCYLQQNNVSDRGVINTENAANLFSIFFKTLNMGKVSVLMLCLLENIFSGYRANCLKAMARSYHSRGKPYSVSRLTEMLGFDNTQQTLEFTTFYGLSSSIDDTGDQCVDLTSWSDSKFSSLTPMSQPFSRLVESRVTDWPSLIYNSPVWETNNGPIMYHTSSSGNTANLTGSHLTKVAQPLGSFPLPTTTSTSSGSIIPQSSTSIPFLKQPSFSNTALSNLTKSSLTTSLAPSFEAASEQKPDIALAKPKIEKVKIKSAQNGNIKPDFVPGVQTQALASTDKVEKVDSVVNGTDAFASFPRSQFDQSDKVIQEVFSRPKPQYSNSDIEVVVDEMIKTTINSELRRLVPQILTWVKSVKEYRESTINNISEEFYKDLVNDLIQETVLESFATIMFNKTLKRLVVKRLIATARYAKLCSIEKKKRVDEYQSMVHSLGASKPHSISISKAHLHPRFHEISQIKLIQETRGLTSTLWKPLNLPLIFRSLDDAFKKQLSFERKIKIAVYCHDWNGTSGAWLRKKLQLIWDGSENSTFENTVRSKSTEVTIGAFTDQPQTYNNIGLLLFECGLESSSHYDSEALRAILSRLFGKTFYQICILIVSWHDRSCEEVFKYLKVDELQKEYSGKYIQQFLFQKIGTEGMSSSDELEIGLTNLCDTFTAELSPRGQEMRSEATKEKSNILERELEEKIKNDEENRLKMAEERYQLIGKYGSLQMPYQQLALSSVPKRKRSSSQGTSVSPLLKSGWDTPKKKKDGTEVIPKSISELQSLLASLKN